MIWLTWRQHRKQVMFTGLALAVLAALIVPTGLAMRATYDDQGLGACSWVEPVSSTCNTAMNQFTNKYESFTLIGILFLVLPLLVGLFWGAPLVAREVEQGTHRLVWTQGISRRRWALVKLGLVGCLAIFAVQATGYYIFRASNNEKNRFRTNPDDPACKHLEFIETASGSKLLVSGWWGAARHINYLGDWILSWSYCLPIGLPRSCAVSRS